MLILSITGPSGSKGYAGNFGAHVANLIQVFFLRVTNPSGIQAPRRRSVVRSDRTHPAKATHSISQPLPNLSCIDQTVRAGGLFGKNSRYTRSISAM
jgi:hypothetical protein